MQTGGMKCLVEHIKLLVSRGHKVIAVHRSDTADSAMPPWTTVQASADIVCGLHQRLGDVYPASKIDVVIVGIFHQVQFASPTSTVLLQHHSVSCTGAPSPVAMLQLQHNTVPHHHCHAG